MGKLLLTALVFFVLLFHSCVKSKVRHTVQYFISGESIMNVSCTDGDGEILFINSVDAAWKYAFNAPADKRIVKLTVNSVDGSSVGGIILIDGQEAALSNSRTGAVSLITQLP